MTYTQMKHTLDQTWCEQPNHVRAIAARYYIGAETANDLWERTRPTQYGRFTGSPVLTEIQAQHIIGMR